MSCPRQQEELSSDLSRFSYTAFVARVLPYEIGDWSSGAAFRFTEALTVCAAGSESAPRELSRRSIPDNDHVSATAIFVISAKTYLYMPVIYALFFRTNGWNGVIDLPHRSGTPPLLRAELTPADRR
jgi:hypothetical protein